ncbi:energy transducer TonB [Phenylobacterium sp.]|uniref:energy transducer TonB family protein n=1 Tax=Phenylobacterium sp. TaxID=1871053 RepID=UPI002DE1F97F|nr:energy transducer TonB [Phenylobacterium sp.]
MPLALIALVAAAAAATPPANPAAPPAAGHQVSPLLVMPQPRTEPPSVTTVQVGGESENIGGQNVDVWPSGALAAGASARVVLTCDVDVHGLAEWCKVAYESPQGRGFGQAALVLRPTFKLTPKQGPNGPVEGLMNIAINYKAPEAENNLSHLQGQTMKVSPSDSSAMGNPAEHELNARNLEVVRNPVAMRRLTMIDTPAWVSAPSFDDMARAYPASGAGVEGYVVAHCGVKPTGVLVGCAAVKETPTRHDFAKAALALTPQFRVSPEALALAPRGAPLEVDVPIRFPPPGEAKDRTVRAPVWLAGADPQSLMRQFPAQLATRKDSPGAIVQCQVAADGALTGCQIELTSPDGIDFDEAAVKVASRMKMNLWSAEAGPVQGGVVHLPVRIGMADADRASADQTSAGRP